MTKIRANLGGLTDKNLKIRAWSCCPIYYIGQVSNITPWLGSEQEVFPTNISENCLQNSKNYRGDFCRGFFLVLFILILLKSFETCITTLNSRGFSFHLATSPNIATVFERLLPSPFIFAAKIALKGQFFLMSFVILRDGIGGRLLFLDWDVAIFSWFGVISVLLGKHLDLWLLTVWG